MKILFAEAATEAFAEPPPIHEKKTVRLDSVDTGTLASNQLDAQIPANSVCRTC